MNVEHDIDPARYPAVITPLEAEMKREFDVTLKKLLVDVTKQLTTAVKHETDHQTS